MLSEPGRGAWMGARVWRPGGRPWCAAALGTTSRAGPARVARRTGEGTPVAGLMSPGQSICQIAMNTGMSRFNPPGSGSRCLACIPYRCFETMPQEHPAGPPPNFGWRLSRRPDVRGIVHCWRLRLWRVD